MAANVENIEASTSPRLESLVSRHSNYTSDEDGEREEEEKVATRDGGVKKEGFNFVTDLPMRMLAYLFYLVTFSCVTSLISRKNKGVYYLCSICKIICQALSISLMLVKIILQTVIVIMYHFKWSGIQDCQVLLTNNQSASEYSKDYILLSVYLWEVSYDITALSCLIYLVHYSYTATNDLTPYKLIVSTRKNRNIISSFENYKFLRSSVRGSHKKNFNTTFKCTNVLTVLWQCVLMLLLVVVIVAVFYYNIRQLVNHSRSTGDICIIVNIYHGLSTINSPQRYLSPVIVCFLNRVAFVKLQTDIKLNSVETFTNLIVSSSAVWLKQRYFQIVGRIRRYSDKFRLIIQIIILSSLLGMSSILIAHLFTREDVLQEVWQTGAAYISNIYITYFVLVSCTWMSIDGITGQKELIRKYPDELIGVIYGNKNNNVLDEANMVELNIITIRDRGSSHFLSALKYVLLCGIVAIVVLAFIGNIVYEGWRGYNL